MSMLCGLWGARQSWIPCSVCTPGGTALVLETGLEKPACCMNCHDVETFPRLMMVSCHRGDADVPMQAWIDLLRRHVTREEWLPSSIPFGCR